MSNIVLSGGDLGGTVVTWPEGETEMVIDGFIYRLVSTDQAVFVGLDA